MFQLQPGRVTQLAALSGSSSLPLDGLATAPTAALSTRKLRTAYAGSCMRVRRSSDNAELDIGFVGNDLDTAALLTHCGAGDGQVKTWYDQSGNGRDFTVALGVTQPTIVSSGALVTTINGKPTLQFDTNDHVDSGVAMGTILSAAAYAVVHSTRPSSGSGTSYGARLITGDSASYLWHTFGTTGGDKVYMGHYDGAETQVAFAITYPSTHVFANRYDGINIKGYLDGGAAASVAAGNIGLTTGTINVGKVASSDNFDGCCVEVAYFNAAISDADLNSLGGAFATYAGTTWAPVS